MSDDKRIIKRAWDDTNAEWDIVATYSQRRSDVATYPNHKYAIKWGWRNGTSNLFIQAAGAGFTGSYCSYYTRRMKLYGKASVLAYVFGKIYIVAYLQYTDSTTGTNLDRYTYVQLGNTVYVNRKW